MDVINEIIDEISVAIDEIITKDNLIEEFEEDVPTAQEEVVVEHQAEKETLVENEAEKEMESEHEPNKEMEVEHQPQNQMEVEHEAEKEMEVEHEAEKEQKLEPEDKEKVIEHETEKTAQEEVEEALEFIVERILDKKIDQATGHIKYLVKWEGYPPSANTWEPLQNLAECDKALQIFEEKQALRISIDGPKSKRRKFEVNDIIGLTAVKDERFFLVSLLNSSKSTFIRASLANKMFPTKVIDFYLKHLRWQNKSEQ